MIRTLLLTGLALVAATSPARAAPTVAAPRAPLPAAPAQDGDTQPLPDDLVARIGGQPITFDAFHQFVGTAMLRFPESDDALRRIVLEAILAERAAALGVTVGEAEVQALRDDLDARARAASGGDQGLLESLGGPERRLALERSLRLAALQRAVVAAERDVAPDELDDATLAAWLERTLADAELVERPLRDPVAADWSGGSISRVELGRRVDELLPAEERAGLLTELLGILAIEAQARAQGVEFTPQAAADELLERERLVRADPRTVGVTYEDVVSQVEKRSVEEVVAGPSFRAEVLLDLLVAQRWGEDDYRELFEQERAGFEQRYGEGVTFELARPGVERLVRQRSYQQLLASSSIERRF